MGNSLTLDRLIQAVTQSQLSLTFKIRLKRTRKQEASPAVAFHPLLADRWSPKRRKPVALNQNKCTISMQIYPNLSPAKGLAPVWIWMSLWQLKAGERWEAETVIGEFLHATSQSYSIGSEMKSFSPFSPSHSFSAASVAQLRGAWHQHLFDLYSQLETNYNVSTIEDKRTSPQETWYHSFH